MSGAEVTRRHEVVRPFVMTGGRTRSERRDIRLETMLSAVPGPSSDRLTSEQAELLGACRHPISVAEASAALGLVVGVTMVLTADLVDAGLIELHQTDPVEIELDVLSRMIERVRSL